MKPGQSPTGTADNLIFDLQTVIGKLPFPAVDWMPREPPVAVMRAANANLGSLIYKQVRNSCSPGDAKAGPDFARVLAINFDGAVARCPALTLALQPRFIAGCSAI